MQIPFDANAKSFPARKDVPKIEGAPDGAAWVWGADDQLGRLNLLTPARVAAAKEMILDGEIIPLNLPLDKPKTPAFGREPFVHSIKTLAPGIAYDDLYTLNTQSGTQWDGLRHFSHLESQTFYNGTKGSDIVGEKANNKCSMQHWAEHGIAGQAVLLDYWGYAKSKGIEYDPYTRHAISYEQLVACGKSQGVDIRPISAGGSIIPGTILLVRSGWTARYNSSSEEENAAAAVRKHAFGKEDGMRYVGLSQEDEIVDWLHDCYFAAVAGDSPCFEAWPVEEEGRRYLHEYILALWGMPLGEMFDLEKLAEKCREKGRWTFFFTSAPDNCPNGVSSHGNALAIM